MESNDGEVTAADGPRRFAFPDAQRYRKPNDANSSVQVSIEGLRYPATIRGRNGPRVQVSFVRDNQSFTQWVNAADVHPPS